MRLARVLIIVFTTILMLGSGSSAWSQLSYLDNGTLRVGVDLGHGGAIGYLSESGSSLNVINVFDLGRYIQQSYYSGPNPFIPPGAVQHPAYAGWGWNPVQAGDVYGRPSLVTDQSNDGTAIYVKCIPKQWALYDVDSECTLETWITLDVNRVHVRNRLNNERADTTRYAPRHQELPAVYTVGTLHHLYTYVGSDPYTGDGLTEINNAGPPWAYWNSTEGWAAHVNDSNWGLGIYHPGATLTVGGFHGTPGMGGPSSVNTGYIAPLQTDLIDAQIVYEYEYTLILGDLYDDIRSYVTAHAPAPGPALTYTRDRQHCYPVNLTDDTPPYDGCWLLVLDQADPQIVTPPGSWRASDVPVIRIRAAHHTQNNQAELFFAGADGLFSGDKRIVIPIIPDGLSHDYDVDMASHPLYTDIITRLRFDPIGGQAPGDIVELHSIVSAGLAPVPEVVEMADQVFLEPGSPNPFGRSQARTILAYDLPHGSEVDLSIFDLSGRRVRTIVRGFCRAGHHEMSWNGRDGHGRRLSSGVYITRLTAASTVRSSELLLIE